MRYSSGLRWSRAKPTGSFRVLQPSTRRVASHDETLKDARKSAAYWTSAVSSTMEIQERFPSGEWVTVHVIKPKQAAAPKRSHATKATHPLDELRRRAAAYGTATAKELDGTIVEILAARRPQGRGLSHATKAHATKLTASQLMVLRDANAGHVYRSESAHDLYNSYDRAQAKPTGGHKNVTAIVARLSALGLLQLGPHERFARPWLVSAHGKEMLSQE